MRWLAVVSVLVFAACDDDSTAPAANDLSVAATNDLAAGGDDLGEADMTVRDLAAACGEPQMPCCGGGIGGTCNATTSTCNAFGVCVPCGTYPMACCPGNLCRANQTCLPDPMTGPYCSPCGHSGQPCCYVGPQCVEPGTSCDTPDGGAPICVP
jgi:hypothetical protein